MEADQRQAKLDCGWKANPSPVAAWLRKDYPVMLLLLVAYMGSHLLLSRLSEPMVQRAWGIPEIFLYLPISPDFVCDHGALFTLHRALRVVFLPASKLDEAFLNGPTPMLYEPMKALGANGAP